MSPVEVLDLRLDRTAAEIAVLRILLTPEERTRADRFVQDIHRNRFITVRGELRRVLGKHLGMDPASVQLTEGAHGKPAVEGFEFNVSHSGDRALIALGGTRVVGVDIEAVRPNVEALDLARRFFHPNETLFIMEAPDNAACLDLFFRYWTLKEAVMKATGEGMHLPPQEILFCPAPDGGLELVRLRGSQEAAAQWRVCEWPVDGAYRAALAVGK